eukprot:9339756-Pyramimonas_sp.AAC.2
MSKAFLAFDCGASCIMTICRSKSTTLEGYKTDVSRARGESSRRKWEKVGNNWTQGEERGRVSGVLCASLPLLAQEDPYEKTKQSCLQYHKK